MPTQRIIVPAVTLLVFACLAIRIGSDFRSRYVNDDPKWNVQLYAGVKKQLLAAATNDGLFIRFLGFEGGAASPTRYYNYGVYTLYPRPVLVGDPSLLANDPQQLLAVNQSRDDHWLAAHHISSVLTLKIDHGDPIISSIHSVQPTHLTSHPEILAESSHPLSCLLYLLCSLLVGYGITLMLINDRPPRLAAPLAGRSFPSPTIAFPHLEAFSLSVVLGPGIIGLFLIFLSMTGLRPSRTAIVLLTIPLAAIALFQSFKKSKSRQTGATERGGLSQKILLALSSIAILYALTTVALTIFHYPALEWDSFSIWQLKAKVLALLPLNPRPDYFTTISLSYSHLRYPILAPMISAGVSAMAGGFDALARAPAFLLICGLAAVIFTEVRRSRGPVIACIATGLLLNSDAMYRYAGAGTAEMALTAFYGCSIVCILRWQREKKLGNLVLLSLFSACMAWTKNEGQALAAINLLVLAAISFRTPGPARWSPLIYFTIVAVLFAPWLLYIHGLPRTDEDYAARLTLHGILANTSRLPEIIQGFASEFFAWQHWGIFWILLILVAILSTFTARNIRTPEVRIVAVLLILHLLAYIPAFMVTNWKISELLAATSDRLLMHAAPAATLLIGFLWPRAPISPRQTPVHSPSASSSPDAAPKS